MTADKLLSIVIVGRNDDYLGGYRYRLQTCLDFLAANLRKLDRLDDVEVVFVDWNSQDKTLADEVKLTPDAASLLRFVIVPPDIAKARNPIASFFTTCAVNVGVRRARGEFIMLADSDSMMPLPALKSLLEILDGTLPTFGGAPNELIYPIPRHQIPGAVAARKPNVAAWTEILKQIFPSRRKELPGGDCLGGFSAAQLMHRDLWFEFGGYNELLDRAWGWSDNELMFRVTQKYSWMDVGYYGVVAFHIEHFASTGNAHTRDPGSVNKMLLAYKPHPNTDDWGLAAKDLPEVIIKGEGKLSSEPHWEPMTYVLDGEKAIKKASRESEMIAFAQRIGQSQKTGVPSLDAASEEAATAAALILLNEYPRNVIHIGGPKFPVLTAIVDGNPGATIYFVQPWPEGDLEGVRGDPGMVSIALANSNYRGFARILSDRAGRAIRNLLASDTNAYPFDLAILYREDLEDDFEDAFRLTLQNLADGGALILVDTQSRFPGGAEEAQAFIGRRLAMEGQPADYEVSGVHHGVFVQRPNETELGAGFDTMSGGRKSVHIIRKRPAAKTVPTALAAE